jgi:hypothetical protein
MELYNLFHGKPINYTSPRTRFRRKNVKFGVGEEPDTFINFSPACKLIGYSEKYVEPNQYGIYRILFITTISDSSN